MSRRISITLIAVVTVIVVGVTGIFAWDAGRSDVIGNGVKIGPVDVSGLSRAEARSRLQGELITPLNTPLVVSVANQTFPLSAREAHIAPKVDAMLDEAVKRGRAGGAFARTWRAISGKGVGAVVAPDVQYSQRAVQRIVDRVRVAVSRKAVDAKVDFKPQAVLIRQARTGRSIDALKLRSDIQTALVSGVHDRRLEVEVRTIQPKVSGKKLAAQYPVVLAVDRGNFRISLFKKLKKVKVYPIAVGQAGLETPAGLYKIQNKAINPAWTVPNSDWAGGLAGQVIPGGTPQNPLKARWLGVYDGVGVHGTDARGSIGTNASHGCIRMLIEDVEKLYDEVPIGTPIFIH
ncbi:MAG TPA: L,D-transpeptidase/peptidoglycan binding protein [Solirubrobacteraceae bacterium]|nr:L,D-transpeptidase/peptidoglycan binding protein [Solirubrobacteraceae bacterium]